MTPSLPSTAADSSFKELAIRSSRVAADALSPELSSGELLPVSPLSVFPAFPAEESLVSSPLEEVLVSFPLVQPPHAPTTKAHSKKRLLLEKQISSYVPLAAYEQWVLN